MFHEIGSAQIKSRIGVAMDPKTTGLRALFTTTICRLHMRIYRTQRHCRANRLIWIFKPIEMLRSQNARQVIARSFNRKLYARAEHSER